MTRTDILEIMTSATPLARQQKQRFEEQLEEARIMRDHFAKRIQEFITSPPPFEYILDFAHWSANYALARDRLDRMFP